MKQLATLAFCACAGPISAASLYLETFSTDNDTSGWFHVSNGTSDFLSQNSGPDNLQAGATDFTTLYAIADFSSSGGAFVGDFAAGGVGGFKFDLNIASGSAVTNLFFELSNLTGGETWAYTLALPAFDTTTTYYVPLSESGWKQNAGTPQAFSAILGNTNEIAIGFGGGGTGSLTATIDNFQAVPEPTSLTLLGFAAFFATTRRRRAV